MTGTEFSAAVLLGVLLFSGALYFVPTMIAGARKHHQGGGILALNIFLGWTLIGWIAALVWACAATERTEPSAALQGDRRPCPQCGEAVMRTARVCRFCRADLAGGPAG